MRVIVYAQDLSGRRDDGYYSKPDLQAALDIFFPHSGTTNFMDPAGEHELTRHQAEEAFWADRRVTFFNEDGEKVVISADPAG